MVDVTVEGAKGAKSIKIKLKYAGRKSIIEGLRRISSPGLRRYTGSQEVPRVRAGMGTSILSTSGRSDDGDASPEEKRRWRVAVRNLVNLCLVLENYRWPCRPK